MDFSTRPLGRHTRIFTKLLNFNYSVANGRLAEIINMPCNIILYTLLRLYMYLHYNVFFRASQPIKIQMIVFEL